MRGAPEDQKRGGEVALIGRKALFKLCGHVVRAQEFGIEQFPDFEKAALPSELTAHEAKVTNSLIVGEIIGVGITLGSEVQAIALCSTRHAVEDEPSGCDG